MEITGIAPADDERLAQGLLSIQRAAYPVEASIIGDDRIPPLHETLDDLRRAPLRWLGAFQDRRLIGAVAWSEDHAEVDIDRLVVDPAAHRQGAGRALVRAVLAAAGHRRTIVSTGRTNLPARTLYESLGFAPVAEKEVIPDLWITQYVRSTPNPRGQSAIAGTQVEHLSGPAYHPGHVDNRRPPHRG